MGLWVGIAYIFAVGFLVGFLIRMAWDRRKKAPYGGTIVVSTDPKLEKTVYSLELDDYPESLRFKKEVVFKIDNKKKSRNRR